MNSENIFSVKNIVTVIILSILVMSMVLGYSMLETPKYKSSAKLLVVFNQENVDTYTASKTSDYITGILSEVIYSDSFIKRVFTVNTNLKDNLGLDSETRQKNWKKLVDVKVKENKGIIMIDVYGNSRYEANQFGQAITSVLVNEHGVYDGSDNRVVIKIIDYPSIFGNWGQIKVVKDTLIGLIAGILAGLTLIVIFPQQRLLDGFVYLWDKGLRRDETIKLDNEYYFSAAMPELAEAAYSDNLAESVGESNDIGDGLIAERNSEDRNLSDYYRS